VGVSLVILYSIYTIYLDTITLLFTNVITFNGSVCFVVLTIDLIGIFIKSRMAKGLSPHSVRWYKGILGEFAQHFPELPQKPEDIYDFLLSCHAGDERRHGYYRALRALYNFLERKREGYPNPIKYIDPPRRKIKQPRPLTPEELQQLLFYPHAPIIKAALLFLSDTGARVGELTNLSPVDINETPYGYIARISGKTGARIVPISPETYHALIKVLPFGFTDWQLRRRISLAFDDAHVKGSGINLRHTFGTLWAGDELILQRIMGHAHLSTTKIYRQLRVANLCEQHHIYSPLNMIMRGTKRMDI